MSEYLEVYHVFLNGSTFEESYYKTFSFDFQVYSRDTIRNTIMRDSSHDINTCEVDSSGGRVVRVNPKNYRLEIVGFFDILWDGDEMNPNVYTANWRWV